MSTLSNQLDEVISQLDYHRQEIIKLRQRKQELENQIPLKNVLQLVKEFLEGKSTNDYHDN